MQARHHFFKLLKLQNTTTPSRGKKIDKIQSSKSDRSSPTARFNTPANSSSILSVLQNHHFLVLEAKSVSLGQANYLLQVDYYVQHTYYMQCTIHIFLNRLHCWLVCNVEHESYTLISFQDGKIKFPSSTMSKILSTKLKVHSEAVLELSII